jgi:hypothetical protein
VRIEVGDNSFARPTVRMADVDALGGRGLFLVDSLSSSWGIYPSRAGKTIWARLVSPVGSWMDGPADETSIQVRNEYASNWLGGFAVAAKDPSGERYR